LNLCQSRNSSLVLLLLLLLHPQLLALPNLCLMLLLVECILIESPPERL
jgi:hypothetical protein